MDSVTPDVKPPSPAAFTIIFQVPTEVFAGAEPIIPPIDPAGVQTIEWRQSQWNVTVMFYPVTGPLGAGTPYWISMDIKHNNIIVVSFIGEIRELCDWNCFNDLYQMFIRDVPAHLLPNAEYITLAIEDVNARQVIVKEINAVKSTIIAEVAAELVRTPPIISNIRGEIIITAGPAIIRVCNFTLYIRYNDREERFSREEFRTTYPDFCAQVRTVTTVDITVGIEI